MLLGLLLRFFTFSRCFQNRRDFLRSFNALLHTFSRIDLHGIIIPELALQLTVEVQRHEATNTSMLY